MLYRMFSLGHNMLWNRILGTIRGLVSSYDKVDLGNSVRLTMSLIGHCVRTFVRDAREMLWYRALQIPGESELPYDHF